MWSSTNNNKIGTITAAMGIIGPQMLAASGTNKGSLLIGGGLNAAPTAVTNTAHFSDNSLFAIGLTGVGNTVATAALRSVDDTTAGNPNVAMVGVTIGGTNTGGNSFGATAANSKSVLYLSNARAAANGNPYTIFANVTDDMILVNGAAVTNTDVPDTPQRGRVTLPYPAF